MLRAVSLGLAATLLLFAYPSSAQRTPTASDLKPPIEDLDEIDGEVVWIQGAVLRGSPAPYRNPTGPLAAYEQGLLDDEGQLWTLLDNPEGRELRYNPDLRGKKVKVRGWFHPKSHILEVYQWFVGAHPVRTDVLYEPPEKKPFNPAMAETIETIPPIPLETIPSEVLRDDLWLLEEGLNLGLDQGPAPSSAPTEEAERLKRLIEDLGSSSEVEPAASVLPEEPPSPPAVSPSEPAETSQPQGFQPAPPPRPVTPAPPLLNERGQPLTTPDEFDEALQRELIQQIRPE